MSLAHFLVLIVEKVLFCLFFAQERPFQQKDVQITQNAYNEHLYPTFRVRILVPVCIYIYIRVWQMRHVLAPWWIWTHRNIQLVVTISFTIPNKSMNLHQWPFQEPKLEVPTIEKRPMFQAYVKGYTPKIWPYMVQYLHFRILEFPLIIWTYINLPYPGMCPNIVAWSVPICPHHPSWLDIFVISHDCGLYHRWWSRPLGLVIPHWRFNSRKNPI